MSLSNETATAQTAVETAMEEQAAAFEKLAAWLKADGGHRSRIGSKMPDQTIYAGISPDSRTPMYTTPTGAPLTYRFNEAAEYARQLNAEKYLGHDDWRVPTKGELNVLFNNRAAIGRFEVTGAEPAGWYWSSSEGLDKEAYTQYFGDGLDGYYEQSNMLSLRCVRG
jgi:hypothetical protein